MKRGLARDLCRGEIMPRGFRVNCCEQPSVSRLVKMQPSMKCAVCKFWPEFANTNVVNASMNGNLESVKVRDKHLQVLMADVYPCAKRGGPIRRYNLDLNAIIVGPKLLKKDSGFHFCRSRWVVDLSGFLLLYRPTSPMLYFDFDKNRGDRIRTCDLLTPSQAR